MHTIIYQCVLHFLRVMAGDISVADVASCRPIALPLRETKLLG
jgi:hypothetical protein